MTQQGASRNVNLLIIGAAKSGTTTLHDRLAALPHAYFSPVKEPNFHSRRALDPSRFSAAFRANHRADSPFIGFVRTLPDYDRLFEAADPTRHAPIGESSTSTLFDPAALESVSALHPGARILVALRNPAERMHSHWGMARKYGFTGLPFRVAVERDMASSDPGWGRTELFYELGLYAQQLAPWLAAWPADRLRVVLTEELGDPATWRDLAAWLGLDVPTDWAEAAATGRSNAGGRARFDGLNRLLTATGLKQRLAGALPSPLKRALKSRYYVASDEPLSAADREWATALYRAEVEALEGLLGRELRGWK